MSGVRVNIKTHTNQWETTGSESVISDLAGVYLNTIYTPIDEAYISGFGDSLPTYEFWVTERRLGFESPTDQMRFLNDLERQDPGKYELKAVTPDGRYIFEVEKS